MYYGWYSPTQARLFGSYFYTSPLGNLVEVTEVTETEDAVSKKFEDIELVSVVEYFAGNCYMPSFYPNQESLAVN